MNRPIVLAATMLARNEPLARVVDSLRQARIEILKSRPSDLALMDECISEAERLTDANVSGRVHLLTLVNRLNPFAAVLTRTRKRTVFRNAAPRVARSVELSFTSAEYELYDWATRSMRGQAGSAQWTGEVFAAIMRQRKAASCLPAFQKELVGGGLSTDVAEASMLAEELGGELPTDMQTSVNERAPVVMLETDSKLAALLSLLAELELEDRRYKAIIFTTFRATARYLSETLRRAGIGHEVLTGEVIDRAERTALVERVRESPKTHLLIATEVGSEGLDLQFCHTLVNYDLPWNPMIVEQRIGRLDRIGQRAKQIRIFNLAIRQTIEERMLSRLFSRLNLFEESVGALEVILGERIQKLALDLARLSPEDQDRRLDEERIAIESIRQDAERLDDEASSLLGDDAYYGQRLVEIDAAQGDIAADLRVFVTDFIHREFKSATLIPSADVPGVFKLTFDSTLLAVLSRPTVALGQGFRDFVNRYAQSREALITFDQRVGEARRDVEFVTSNHGLIRLIANKSDDASRVPIRFFSVQIRDPEVAPGDYLLGISLQRISGIRPRMELAPAALLLNEGQLVPDPAADAMLAAVLRDGSSLEVEPNATRLIAGFDLVEDGMVARLTRRASIARDENALFISRRVDSLRRWYDFKIAQAEQQAAVHSEPGVRRMAQGRASKLTARLGDELRRAEATAGIEQESRTEAFVYVHCERSAKEAG
jgi:hypothetical protein